MGKILQKVLVTGAAGFIGSNLVDRLLFDGYSVIGVDNLVTGQESNLKAAFTHANFQFHKLDILHDKKKLLKVLSEVSRVFHLSANADVRYGPENPFRDFEQNTKATLNLLDSMRRAGVEDIAFSSTGSIYGETETIPTPENAPFPIQTSLYGASKLAAEGLIQAFGAAYGIKSWIFRFVSVLGPRYSHGHVVDFYNQLKMNPSKLNVLGNGYQRKSYMHVSDCVDGMLLVLSFGNEKTGIFNLGLDSTCTVRESVSWICEELGLTPEISYGSEKRGWIGDNPIIELDCRLIKNLGWVPKYNIEESVRNTIRHLNNLSS
jgi:UDP-glucose 4-epimerase